LAFNIKLKSLPCGKVFFMRFFVISFVLLFTGFTAQAQAQEQYKVRDNQLILPVPIAFNDHANDVVDTADAMLEYVANFLRSRSDVTKLTIEAHVFTEANSFENMKLSLQRAAILSYYLTLKGIPCSILTASGFGDTRPLDATMGQYANTRLEFHIEEIKQVATNPCRNLTDCKFYNPCED
jgi:outer membrane protein OmpA-like peptidoglycan-associated protein